MVGLLLGGLSIATLHAILPNHWMPFVLVGQAQKWSKRKTLSIAALAGGGHIVLTTVLGGLIVWAGVKLSARLEEFFAFLAGAILILVGILYGISNVRHRGHSHAHHGHERLSDKAAAGSLIAVLTFSPCEAFLPVYLLATPYGWVGFVVLSAVLATGTLGGMLALTGLTLAGLERMAFPRVERYAGLIVGSIMVLLGGSVVLLH